MWQKGYMRHLLRLLLVTPVVIAAVTHPPLIHSTARTTDDYWVDAENGDDSNNGLTPGSAFRTIQKAADLAAPGTTVHILPGIYRETVRPILSGSESAPVRYIAEAGPGTAVIRGSAPSSALGWTQLENDTIGLPPDIDPTKIYYTDLSQWNLDKPPRFVVELDDIGQVTSRLPLAHEPDWHVVTEWKYHEYWWAADGGWDVAGCDPPTDPDPFICDYEWRSTTDLTDRTDDPEPADIEPGNLTTLGNLTGGTLVSIDSGAGHYIFRREITDHDVAGGRITVDPPCEHGSGSGRPGLGWGSKYYVEGMPFLLDNPGEWWYDEAQGYLYLWPRMPGDPATQRIEISHLENGFTLGNRSYITLDGLTIEFFDENAIYQANGATDRSYCNTVRNVELRYANRGLWISQYVHTDSPAEIITTGFTVDSSEIAHMDTAGIRMHYSWPPSSQADSFLRAGVRDTAIHNSELHHLGFRTDGDDATGSSLIFPDHLRFEGNHVHHVGHNGLQIMRSVVQSPDDYGYEPHEILTGDIVVKDNVFEKACQLTGDCGALKISGSSAANRYHVFRDFLVTGNVFRDTLGWTYASEKRGHWTGGPSSDVRGLGGFGLYVDMASGIHAYRNVAYNNAFAGFKFSGVWRDSDIVYHNNIAANSLYGFHMGGGTYDTHGSVNTQLVNNIILNNEGYGILQDDGDGVYENTIIDYNLYYLNGWRAREQGGLWEAGNMAIADPVSYPYYPTLADIQAGTDWETHGVEGNPQLWEYDAEDHDFDDGSWPDFHLTVGSDNAIDRGTVNPPDSLAALVNAFGVDDPRRGSAYDIGRYEAGFAILGTPPVQSIEPGGVAHYTLHLHPTDLPHAVTLSTASPSPNTIVVLEPATIALEHASMLTITSTHLYTELATGLLYAIPITGTGGGFELNTDVVLLIGGTRYYLPVVMDTFYP